MIEAHFLAEEDLQKADTAYFRELVHQIPARVTEIDTALDPLLDRPLIQVDPVECAILRIGAYELMQRPDIPTGSFSTRGRVGQGVRRRTGASFHQRGARQLARARAPVEFDALS